MNPSHDLNSTQSRTLCFPGEMRLPDDLQTFTAEENALMILVGRHAVLFMRHDCAAPDIRMRQADWRMLYDNMFATKTTELATAKSCFTDAMNMEQEKRESLVHECVKTMGNTYDTFLQEQCTESKISLKDSREKEREAQNQLHETKLDVERMPIARLEEALAQPTLLEKNQKANCIIGQEGEAWFEKKANEVFENYDGYELVDKSKVPHSADFHLKFADFTIMVDTKNTTSNVNKNGRDKLKEDMTKYPKIKIAWLVSLQKGVATRAEYPFMCDIENDVCYLYINKLCKTSDPEELLTMAWYMSSIIYKHVLAVESEANVLMKYKKYEIKVKKTMDTMIKLSKEREEMIERLSDNCAESERFMTSCRNVVAVDIKFVHTEAVEKWFRAATEKCGEKELKTDGLYKKFMETDANKEHGIIKDRFKDILKEILQPEEVTVGKLKKTQYTIKGVQYRDIKVDTES